MKPPGWIKFVRWGDVAPDGKSVTMIAKVRWWHPGLWLELLRHGRRK